MNIKVLCVGKLKEKYWKDAEAEYTKRLSSYCNLKLEEVKESLDDNVTEEGKNLIKKIGDKDFVITLEIGGQGLSSEGLAEKLSNLAINGKSNVTFVIGGSNGLSKEVSSLSNLKLSFSKMTFPHQMMRTILLEQIYRGFKINKKEKYHK